jgi:hypothetical protein
MSNFNFDWCVYETRHPSGFYYIGKAKIDRIYKGYKGSGTRLKTSFLQEGFHKSTWKTDILQVFRTEEEAYQWEAWLLPIDRLADPFCLNSKAGGRHASRKGHSALL